MRVVMPLTVARGVPDPASPTSRLPDRPFVECRLRLRVPGPQVGERIERLAAGVPAGSRPLLEVQVAAAGAAGVAHEPDQLTRLHALALVHERRLAQVHVDEVGTG